MAFVYRWTRERSMLGPRSSPLPHAGEVGASAPGEGFTHSISCEALTLPSRQGAMGPSLSRMRERGFSYSAAWAMAWRRPGMVKPSALSLSTAALPCSSVTSISGGRTLFQAGSDAKWAMTYFIAGIMT